MVVGLAVAINIVFGPFGSLHHFIFPGWIVPIGLFFGFRWWRRGCNRGSYRSGPRASQPRVPRGTSVPRPGCLHGPPGDPKGLGGTPTRLGSRERSLPRRASNSARSPASRSAQRAPSIAEGHLKRLLQYPLTVGRKQVSVSTAVSRVRPAAHEPEPLEVVYERHHTVRVDPERLTDRPLGLPLAEREGPEQAEVARLYAQRALGLRGQLLTYLEPEPRDEEPATLGGAAPGTWAALSWATSSGMPAV